MNAKNIQIIVAIVTVIGFSTATALVIHHNDKISNDHAMMMSDAMQAKAVKKAASDAAMKQQETDKMAAHDAMMHDSSTQTTSTPATAQ